MAKQLRLSQCMIVKNEEKDIVRALSWGKDIMYEQIVVDTGSTDRTVELAQSVGAKVFHFGWIDDFAAAKNYAVEQASGDWIIFLDADEYFLPEDAGRLLPTLQQLHGSKYNVLITGWIQTEGNDSTLEKVTDGKVRWFSSTKEDGSKKLVLSGTKAAIFQNLPGLRFRRRIHEELSMADGQLLSADASDSLSILHTGYAEAATNRQKVQRNITLLRKELEINPDDYTMLACMGDSYSELDDPKEAAVWYEQALHHLPPELAASGSVSVSRIFKKLLTLYMIQLSDEEAALNIYARARHVFPKDADYDYVLGQIYADQEQWEQAAQHLQTALAILEASDGSGGSVMLLHNLIGAWELLVTCHYEAGNLQQCVSCAVTVLKADPGRRETLEKLLLSFRADAERSPAAAAPAQVKGFLGNFYDLRKTEDRSFVTKAAKATGYEGLIQELEIRD